MNTGILYKSIGKKALHTNLLVLLFKTEENLAKQAEKINYLLTGV